MVQFDSLGNLYPYDVNPISHEEFYQTFIEGGNLPEIRKQRWKQYNDWLEILKSHIKADFHVWIFGSIITLNQYKNESDIDVMIIIPKTIYDYLDKQNILHPLLADSKCEFNVGSFAYWIVEANSDHYEED